MKITREAFKKMASDGKVFTVTFIKKDGSTRVMNARLGVKKHLKGGTMSYDPKKYNLLPVFDMQKKGYRMINFNTIQKIVMNGVTISLEKELIKTH